MTTVFRQVALIGKYHAGVSGTVAAGSRAALEDIARFLVAEGCEVFLEHDTATASGIVGYPVLDVPGIGASCDLGLVVGGDGTMLGIGRQLASFGVPLVGINQGRLGFITDIALDNYRQVLAPMLRGDYEEDRRTMMQACVMRGGDCVFRALAMNDVVVNRGATSGMVELRVEVDGHFVANQRADGLIVASPTGSTAYSLSAGGALLHLVAGRGASANFDMQSLASLLHGDRILVRRSEHQARFLHPKGWSYYDTLRKKLHWNEGGS
jgi:NAD+ kinase